MKIHQVIKGFIIENLNFSIDFSNKYTDCEIRSVQILRQTRTDERNFHDSIENFSNLHFWENDILSSLLNYARIWLLNYVVSFQIGKYIYSLCPYILNINLQNLLGGFIILVKLANSSMQHLSTIIVKKQLCLLLLPSEYWK